MADVVDSYEAYSKSLKPKDREAILMVIDDLEDSKRQHDAYRYKVEQWYRAYRGVLEKQTEAAQWTSKNHPPFAYSLVESVVANMIDDRTIFHFQPRPIIDDANRLEDYVLGAKAIEGLVRYELQMDQFDRKQRPIALQNSIAGMSPVKILWDYQEGVGRRYVTQDKEVRHPETDEVIATYPVLVEEEHTRIVRDGPSVGPIDVRDFFWPDNADDIQSARYIIHRVWMSMDELRALEQQGVYKNVDQLSESRDIMDWEKVMWRSDDLFMTNRKRRMVEVLERWGDDGRVTTVANRKVLLSDRRPEDNDDKPMFWHGKKPFVMVSSMPQPFGFVGVSDMETIYHLQNALWTSINQTADNVALLNNAIFIISDTVDDEDMEFAPGEFWQFENPATDFQQWQPNPLPTELGVGFQDRLRGYINEITGGLGMIAGGDDQMSGQTATGVSSLMSVAQRRLQARRAQFGYAYQDMADMVVSDLQQFMKADRLVPIIGMQGAMEFQRVSPMQIQGRYVADVEALSEDMMRQQRRAEAQALLTLALQGAPLAAATGMGLNLQAWYTDLLEAFDKVDVQKYFTAGQAAGLIPQGQQQGGGGAPGAPPVPPPQPGQVKLTPQPMGVTSPTASAITSPSSAVSQSPMMMMQRALAMRGGGRNA